MRKHRQSLKKWPSIIRAVAAVALLSFLLAAIGFVGRATPSQFRNTKRDTAISGKLVIRSRDLSARITRTPSVLISIPKLKEPIEKESHIALALMTESSAIVPLVSDAYVVENVPIALSVSLSEAMLLRAVEERGRFVALTIPTGHSSPFAGKTARSLAETEQMIERGIRERQALDSSTSSRSARDWSSRLWVLGDPSIYFIEKGGRVRQEQGKL